MDKKKRLLLLIGVPLLVIVVLLILPPTRAWLFEGKISYLIVQSVSSTSDNFRENQVIHATVEPADLELYRKILPKQFDMPEHPLVDVLMIDQLDVGPWPLTPYMEGCVNLRAAYKGEEGWHITSLPVSKWVASYAGRTMGYPKFVADKITFEKVGTGWRSEMVHKGKRLLLVEFTPGEWKEQPDWSKNGWDTGGPTLNLMPPGKGPDVVRVGSSSRISANTTVVKGMVTITIGKDQPCAGLVPAGTTVPGQYVKTKGGRSLVPEKK